VIIHEFPVRKAFHCRARRNSACRTGEEGAVVASYCALWGVERPWLIALRGALYT
jgi:hypothetical protein